MTRTMHAVGYRQNLAVDDRASLVDLMAPVPEPRQHDLLVRVRAVSVNPVDTKIRRGSPVAAGDVRILGFDAAGTVEAVGAQVTRFGVGDDVYYAGVTNRQGSNAELQLVDEHIVGHKPATLDFAQAAALPLTTITAWEGLFHHLGLRQESTGTLVAVSAAGGVGSMVTQLARTQTQLTVIATASRPKSARFATALGAHHVVDHHDHLAEQVLSIAPDGVEYIFSPYSPTHLDAYAQMLRPLGHVVGIDSAPDLSAMRPKSITWHWELMFTRPLFLPNDDYQHRLLQETADLVDTGVLRTTATEVLDGLEAATLREAHRMVETSAMVGKVVIAF